MGERDAARVDIGALLDAAGRYDAVADALDGAVRTHLAATFAGAVAGRAHAARGDAVRSAVERLGDDLRMWARSSAELASALRGSADRYVAAEARGAVRLG